jgi:hypothetical protein
LAVWWFRLLDVVVEELFELLVVPDEGPVAELAADGPDPAFGVGVRDGRVRRGTDDCCPVASENVIEAANELSAPSRIKNRTVRS